MHKILCALASCVRTLHCIQNQHQKDEERDERQLEAAKYVFKLAEDLVKDADDWLAYDATVKGAVGEQHTRTGNRLIMMTRTRNTDIQTALSTLSPVCQLRKVVPSS